MNTIKPTKEEIQQAFAERQALRIAELQKVEAPLREASIKKADLVDYAWYVGECRNATVAQWIANKNHFIYIRHKFCNAFVEEINHFEDDKGYDVFFPARKV